MTRLQGATLVILCSIGSTVRADWTQWEVAYTVRTIRGKQNVDQWRRTNPLAVSSFETATSPALQTETGIATLTRATSSWKLEVKGRGYDRIAVWDGKNLYVKTQNHVTVLPTCDPTFLEVLPRIGQNLPGLQINKPADVANAVYVLDHRSRRGDRKLSYNFTSFVPASRTLKVLPSSSFFPTNHERRVSPTRFETLLDTESSLTYETYDIVSKKQINSKMELTILPHLSEGTVVQFPGPISFRFDPKGGSLEAQLARRKRLGRESEPRARSVDRRH